jgi:hypothetical protein
LSVSLKMDEIEYRAVIKFFVKEGLTSNEIHSKLINFLGTILLRFHQLRNGLPSLTIKGRMLDTSNAACTSQWPNVRYIECRACIKFFSAHSVCLSRKSKQTCYGSHNKAWYSSGAMTSFVAVWVLIFMCTLDLGGSAEGVKGTTR